jgi:hypothetical protein
VKVKAVKLLLASDVLDWLVLQATFDQVLIDGLLVGGKFALWVGEEICARDLQYVEEQKFGVAGGSGANMLVSGEFGCGGGDGLAKRHAGCYLIGGWAGESSDVAGRMMELVAKRW